MAEESIAKILKYEGLISAPFTAFGADGEVRVDLIPQYVDYLLEKQGVRGAFVNGTTGEGLSLTVEERKRIAEAWVKAGKDKLDVIIIHIGANSLRDAQELARHAQEIGATGIASLPPLFYKAVTLDHLVTYFKALADAAPKIPLMLYHIPSFSGVEISLGDFLPKARKEIPTFCGAKFTSVDVRDLLKCHRPSKNPPVKILSGFDEVLLPCLASGITAAVGASYNFMGRLSLKIMDAYKNGDNATAWRYQQKVHEALEIIVKRGQAIACLKETMNQVSPMYFGPPRLPLVALSPRTQEDLTKDLQKLGADSWSTV